MTRRRTRRNRGGPRRAIIPYDFSGWTSAPSKSITPDDLHISVTRPFRCIRISAQFTTTATTGTYMVPSNIATVVLEISSYNGVVVRVSPPRLTPFGATTRTTVNAPRGTDFGYFDAKSSMARIYSTSFAAGTTLSFCGTMWIEFSPHRFPDTVKMLPPSEDETSSFQVL